MFFDGCEEIGGGGVGLMMGGDEEIWEMIVTLKVGRCIRRFGSDRGRGEEEGYSNGF